MQIDIRNLSCDYDGFRAVHAVNLSIESGEFVAVLGPSGCGKTTLLKALSGLETISEGSIHFDNRRVDTLPPRKRNAVMVFQNYALFPHINVRDNVNYGLKVRSQSKSTHQHLTDRALERVRMTAYKERQIDELSGGQQQRIALARALVVSPDVLLFDEPLSNLDEQLRIDMRQEIRHIQKEEGITSLYVTHDQDEAMAIADRIVVMNDGMIQQIGTPEDIYRNPANLFTAEFVGECNILHETDETITIGRPEDVLYDPKSPEFARVEWVEYKGSLKRIKLTWKDKPVKMDLFTRDHPGLSLAPGESIPIRFDHSKSISLSR
ncbi:ABC transporter ATP-binding protein [Salisediminibacterium selenitireducens]|uniref:ABC transporter related protein n=1 Tax=Bacillus selenitireducens (strain ATCC 700615 / DSM 15326 / MLS10) TaxID=439292 RepID=D6XXV0_BACIE|nr:ABC transporter ATP-binding protein [Salisediminibacterium selenitireducens]ADI00143.1 ABC transporter related protein [[Bacillus] selenitireducens MLS10]